MLASCGSLDFPLNHNVIMSVRVHLDSNLLSDMPLGESLNCRPGGTNAQWCPAKALQWGQTASRIKSHCHHGSGRPQKPESTEGSAEAPPPPATRQALLVCISITAPPKSMNKDLFKWELSKCVPPLNLHPPLSSSELCDTPFQRNLRPLPH